MRAPAFLTQKIFLRENWKVLILGFPLVLTNLEKSFHNSKNSPIGGKFVKNGHIGKPLTRPCKRPPSEDPLGELGCLLLGWVNGKYIGKCGVCPGFDPGFGKFSVFLSLKK